ncbi:hypothetical protein [Neobacillus piezotolerans]|nr:hypothetical protein [Neobacillus piezotolerans]
MSKKRDKGYSQKGQPSAKDGRQMIAREDLEKETHPTNRQNSKQ